MIGNSEHRGQVFSMIQVGRALPAQFALGVLVPQLLFFVGLRLGGLGAGLIVAGGWSLTLQLYTLWRQRRMDPLILYGLTFTIVQGVATLSARSPAVYAGAGIAENLIAGVACLGSVMVRRPLLIEVWKWMSNGRAPLPLPAKAALGRLTVHWAFLFLARCVVLYAAVMHLTIGQFLLVNTVTGWPLNGVGVVLSLLYLQRRLPQAHRFLAPYTRDLYQTV